MLMQDQNEKENLQGILTGVNRLITDTLSQRAEIELLDKELQMLFNQGKMTELTYQLEHQTTRRAQRDVNYCLKSLENQKKLALWKLRELD